jgi:ABC-2 type transport system permease protein
MKRFLMLTTMYARTSLRNRQALGWTILFPTAMMLFWGYIGRDSTTQAGFDSPATVAYAGFMMGGMMILTALSQGIMGNSQGMAAMREQGILRRVRCTPLPIWTFLLSRMVTEVVVTLIGCLLIVVIAVGLFGVRLSPRTLPAALGILLLAIALFIAIGQLVAGLARKPETARAAAQTINFPLMFVGGIFLQPEFFPKPLAMVAQWTPAAVVADLLRPALLLGDLGGRPAVDLAVLVAYLVATVALAARFFRWEAAA